MKVSQIYDLINAYAPYDTQSSFDNSGLNVGDPNKEISSVLTCVDVSLDVLEEAQKKGCDLIVSHHPIIFRPLPNLVSSDYVAKVVMTAVQKGISLLSAHTNMDKAAGGINDRLAELLGGKNIHKLLDVDEYATFFDVEETCVCKFSKVVSEVLQDDRVCTIGKGKFTTVAVVGGAGGGDYDIIDYCLNNNVLLVTAELKHHLARMVDDRHGKMITMGHFTGERVFVNIIEQLLTDQVAVQVSEQVTPFNTKCGKE